MNVRLLPGSFGAPVTPPTHIIPFWCRGSRVALPLLSPTELYTASINICGGARKLVVSNRTPRHASKRLSEPVMVLTISLVEPENLLVLEPPSVLQAGGDGSRKGDK